VPGVDALVDTVVWLLPFGILFALVVLRKRTGWKPPLWAERKELRDLMSQPRLRDQDRDEP
jgi:hypothetical protein